MKWDNLLAIVLAGFLGAIVGSRLDDHFNPRYQLLASLLLTGLPSAVLATSAWVLVSCPGSIVLVLSGLVVAGVTFTVCLFASQLAFPVLVPLAILATGWALGSALKRWILVTSLPVIGVVLSIIGLGILIAGGRRQWWQWDSLLVLGFLTCAWAEALALEGIKAIRP